MTSASALSRPPAADACVPLRGSSAGGLSNVRGSGGLEYDEREAGGGGSRVVVGVWVCCVEPRGVAGGDFNVVVADLERDRAAFDGEQFERSRAVWVAGASVAGLQRPRPQLERSVADEQAGGTAGRCRPQRHRVLS